jgi:predicted nucleic acid-binding protein
LSAYVDSSFLVSSYITDAHSIRVDKCMAGSPSVWLTEFNRAELANAVFQQVFLKRLTPADAAQVWSDFKRDCADGVWAWVGFPLQAWETCADLARRFGPTLGVRTLDSLHVACALELKAERFWTFDERQARLAKAVGLDTSA